MKWEHRVRTCVGTDSLSRMLAAHEKDGWRLLSLTQLGGSTGSDVLCAVIARPVESAPELNLDAIARLLGEGSEDEKPFALELLRSRIEAL